MQGKANLYLHFLVKVGTKGGTHLLNSKQDHGSKRKASVELVLHDVNLFAEEVGWKTKAKHIGTC